MTSVPLNGLALYSDWAEAPLGAVLSYAGPVFLTPPGGQGGNLYEGPKIAIRAASSAGLQDFLVIVQPHPTLAARVSNPAQGLAFGSVEAQPGPAVDVTSHYDLHIAPAPVAMHLHNHPEELTVIRTRDNDPTIMVAAGKIGRRFRYMILVGQNIGKLVEPPMGMADVIGKLTLVEKAKT